MSSLRLLAKIRDLLLDFLFPKSAKVLTLESIPSGKLSEILPPPDPIKDENVIALYDYKHPVVKEFVWELKYKGNPLVAEKFGEVVYDVLLSELEERSLFEKFERPILMPMPVSDKRRLERGWNQAELICEGVKKLDKTKIFKYRPRQLVKHFHTESQTKAASKKERLENLRGSMKLLSPHVVYGECVILIDDVYTTGATFGEARRALREAGAKKIICLAIAH